MNRAFERAFENQLYELLDKLAQIPSLDIELFDPEKTVLVMMDMTVGIIKNKAEFFEPFLGIIEPVRDLLIKFKSKGIKSIAFADMHTEKSVEFRCWPKHCISGTDGAEIIKELSDIGGFTKMGKNSLNAFHSPEFQTFLKEHDDIENYVVCGVSSDISVLNFCLTLKSYFDQSDKEVNVIIPYNAIETFSQRIHENDIANVLALQHMASQGIEIVKDIY